MSTVELVKKKIKHTVCLVLGTLFIRVNAFLFVPPAITVTPIYLSANNVWPSVLIVFQQMYAKHA
jgi:hypothetical protein